MTPQSSVIFPKIHLKTAKNSGKQYKKRVLRAVFALNDGSTWGIYALTRVIQRVNWWAQWCLLLDITPVVDRGRAVVIHTEVPRITLFEAAARTVLVLRVARTAVRRVGACVSQDMSESERHEDTHENADATRSRSIVPIVGMNMKKGSLVF